jgi:hypothetical protein
MDNPPSTKKFLKPSKSDRAERATRQRIKALGEGPIEAQLAQCDASQRTENGINYDGSSLGSAPIQTESVEKAVLLPVESIKTTEPDDESTLRANRKMMGKVRRAFRKAGKPDAPEAELSAFLTSLLDIRVPVLQRSSARIAKVLTGERNIESLLLTRIRPNSA